MSTKIRASKEQSSEAPTLITSLPEGLIVDIIARVPRCKYPTLSFVSKHFCSLVASPELYARRSLLGCTEHSLYVLLYNTTDHDLRWYILHRKPNGNRHLVLIPSVPAMPSRVGYIAVGLKIYVFGVFNHRNVRSGALCIDCTSHTVQTLPNMPIPMVNTVAGISNGKIYVKGYCEYDLKKVMMVVFNTETHMWEPEIIKADPELANRVPGRVLMADKMVDGALYYYDSYENRLKTYDPKKRCWGVVNGLEELFPKTRGSLWSETVCYGGKLALFFVKRKGITIETWCAEILLVKHQGGEIWGKIEWCDHVMTSGDFHLEKSLAVMF